MARKRSWGKSHMAWVRSFSKRGRKNSPRRKRRGRRNPYPLAGTVINPRRKRYARRRRNPVATFGGGTKLFGLQLPNVMDVVYGAVGFVGTPIAEGFANSFLPVSITASTIGKYAVRVGLVAAETWIAKMVLGRRAATLVGIGGGAYVLVSAVREFAPGMIPGLSAYKVAASGPTAMAGMNAYPRTIGQNRTTLGAPAYGAQRSARFAGSGGMNVVANRFRRFQ